MNSVCITGRLGADPELKVISTGLTIVNIKICFTTFVKGQKKPNWIKCIAFNKVAEDIQKYFTKGDQIGIQGSLAQNSWTDQQGKTTEYFEIIINSVSYDSCKKTAAAPQPSVATQPSVAPGPNFQPLDSF